MGASACRWWRRRQATGWMLRHNVAVGAPTQGRTEIVLLPSLSDRESPPREMRPSPDALFFRSCRLRLIRRGEPDPSNCATVEARRCRAARSGLQSEMKDLAFLPQAASPAFASTGAESGCPGVRSRLTTRSAMIVRTSGPGAFVSKWRNCRQLAFRKMQFGMSGLTASPDQGQRCCSRARSDSMRWSIPPGTVPRPAHLMGERAHRRQGVRRDGTVAARPRSGIRRHVCPGRGRQAREPWVPGFRVPL